MQRILEKQRHVFLRQHLFVEFRRQMAKLEENKKNSLGPVEWWIRVKNKIKRLVIDHSTRLEQESLAIENNLKYQLDQLANSPNFKSNLKLCSEIKRKLINLQIEKHKKKLIKNDELFQYSHNLATKEFFRQFIQKREKVVTQELVDEYGLPRTSPGELGRTRAEILTLYTALYGCDQNDTTKQTVFLDNVNAKLSDQQNSNLQLDLSK